MLIFIAKVPAHILYNSSESLSEEFNNGIGHGVLIEISELFNRFARNVHKCVIHEFLNYLSDITFATAYNVSESNEVFRSYIVVFLEHSSGESGILLFVCISDIY